jgi:hypothetical protein
MIRVACQICKEEMSVPDSLIGQFEACPTCKTIVAVPGWSKPEVPAAWLAPGPRTGGPMYICPNPNCGYRGPAVRKARGSLIVAILLWVLIWPVGLVYSLMNQGYRQTCPRCSGNLGGR